MGKEINAILVAQTILIWTYEVMLFVNLTHLCLMEFPFLIIWTSPFPFFELLGGIFYFNSNFKRTFDKQKVETLIRCRISGSALFALTHKKHAYMS